MFKKIKLLSCGKEKKIIIAICSIILLALLGSLYGTYEDFVKPTKDEYIKEVNYEIDPTQRIKLVNNAVIRQKVRTFNEEITGFSLAFDFEKQVEKGNITVDFAEQEGQVLHQWILDTDLAYVNIFSTFYLNELFKLDPDKSYELRISYQGKDSIYLYKTDISEKTPSLYRNNKKEKGVLAYQMLGVQGTHTKPYFIMLAIGLIGVILLIVILSLIEAKLEVMFVVLALVTGILYMFVITPYQVPDEAIHFRTVYAKSSKILGEKIYNKKGEVFVRKVDYFYHKNATNMAGWKLDQKSYVKVTKGFFAKLTPQDKELIATEKDLDGVLTISYAPQILGVTIARILGLNAVQLFMLGRFMALLIYLAIMYWTIKIMPFAKMMLFSIGFFPLVMQQVASYNYDAIILPLSFFAIAYLMKLIYEKEKIQKRDIVVLITLSLILSPIKVVYILIFGLGLLIPYEKFGNKKRKVLAAGGVLLGGIGGILVVQLAKLTNMAGAGYTGLSWTTEKGYTLGELLKTPLETVGIFLRTAERMTDFYVTSGVGGSMGWLDFGLPTLFVFGFIIILLVSSLKTEQDTVAIKRNEKGWMLCIFLGVSIAIYLSMLLAWTRASSIIIEGVQGRYFLPVLPLLCLIIRNNVIKVGKNIDYYLICGLGFFQVYSLLFLFREALIR